MANPGVELGVITGALVAKMLPENGRTPTNYSPLPFIVGQTEDGDFYQQLATLDSVTRTPNRRRRGRQQLIKRTSGLTVIQTLDQVKDIATAMIRRREKVGGANLNPDQDYAVGPGYFISWIAEPDIIGLETRWGFFGRMQNIPEGFGIFRGGIGGERIFPLTEARMNGHVNGQVKGGVK